MKHFISSLLFASFAFLTLSAEECGTTHLISDSGFDLWCGNTLCNWELQKGSLERTSSWHKGDFAVEMVGDNVVISQLSTRDPEGCIRFEMLVDIEENAKVTLSMDFFDDGVIDYSQEIGRVRWESLVYLVPTPTVNSVRFSLNKQGQGRAVLAQIEATVSHDCVEELVTFQMWNQIALGGDCLLDSDCASGECLGTNDVSICSSDGRDCSENLDCPGDTAACLVIGRDNGICQ